MDFLWNWQWKSIFTSEYSWWNREKSFPVGPGLIIVGGLPAFPALMLVHRELLGTVTSHFKSREQNNQVKEVFWNLFSSYASFFGELFVHPIKSLCILLNWSPLRPKANWQRIKLGSGLLISCCQPPWHPVCQVAFRLRVDKDKCLFVDLLMVGLWVPGIWAK